MEATRPATRHDSDRGAELCRQALHELDQVRSWRERGTALIQLTGDPDPHLYDDPPALDPITVAFSG